MLTPVSTRPRLSVGVLVFPFVCGLVFFATSSLARHAGTEWSPQPNWTQPVPAAAATAPPVAMSRCTERTASGLGYQLLAGGDATVRVSAQGDDKVQVLLAGWTQDGEPLAMPPGPSYFRVNQLIPGFVEGLPLMAVGDRMRLCIPEELAYKGRPHGPHGTLIFDVELLAIERAPAR